MSKSFTFQADCYFAYSFVYFTIVISGVTSRDVPIFLTSGVSFLISRIYLAVISRTMPPPPPPAPHPALSLILNVYRSISLSPAVGLSKLPGDLKVEHRLFIFTSSPKLSTKTSIYRRLREAQAWCLLGHSIYNKYFSLLCFPGTIS